MAAVAASENEPSVHLSPEQLSPAQMRALLEPLLPSGVSTAYVTSRARHDLATHAWLEEVDEASGATPCDALVQVTPWEDAAWHKSERAVHNAVAMGTESAGSRLRDGSDGAGVHDEDLSLAQYLNELDDSFGSGPVWDNIALNDPAASAYSGAAVGGYWNDMQSELERIKEEEAEQRWEMLCRGGPTATALLLRVLHPGITPEVATPEALCTVFAAASKASRCTFAVHPNLLPVTAALVAKGRCVDGMQCEMRHLLVTTPAAEQRRSLHSLLMHSPTALEGDDCKRLLCYQISAALACVHAAGIAFSHPFRDAAAHGLDAHNVFVGGLPGSPHVWLAGPVAPPVLPTAAVNGVGRGGGYVANKADRDLRSATAAWQAGALSNLDYLLLLNHFAGRARGNRAFHAVVPWVTDFIHDPAGDDARASWRDLTKTKWRLAKGDQQLDFTYARSEPPHHISDDCLSELAVCIYKARRLDLSILRQKVRTVFVANEYPGTMARLFEWSPDEAIPEFYDDPEVFKSTHPGVMSDLAVPHWASGPEDFVKRHRAALESPEVTAMLPAWIDLTFGAALTGKAAVAAKNVMVPPVDPSVPLATGRVKLFTNPHPPRVKLALEIPMSPLAPPTNDHNAALTGGEAISLKSDPSALIFSLDPSRTIESSNTVAEITPPMSLSEAKRSDLSALGKLFAAVYARNPALATASDATVASIAPSLPIVVRATVTSLIGVVASDDEGGGGAVTVPSAAAVRDSTMFPGYVREAARALSALRSSPSLSELERVEMAAAMLSTGENGDQFSEKCFGNHPETVALFTPGAVAALRHALAVVSESAPAGDTARLARSAASIVARVAKNAPRVVAHKILIALLADLLAPRLGEDMQNEGDGVVDADARVAPPLTPRDAVMCAVASPAVLAEVQRALGVTKYRRCILPLLARCLHRTCPELPAAAASRALAAAAVADGGALPATLRAIVQPLLRSLGEGPHVVDALVRISEVLGTPATVRHVLPALELCLGEREQHLPNVVAGAHRVSPNEEGLGDGISLGEEDLGGGGDGRNGDTHGVSASSIAAAEAAAVKNDWMKSPLMVLSSSSVQPAVPGAQKIIDALSALEVMLRSLPAPAFVERFFPRHPRAPGPLLSILLLPVPSLPILKAVVAVVLTAASRAGPATVATSIVTRVRPVFSVVANAPLPAWSGGCAEDPPSALAVVRELYPGLSDVLGLQTMHELVPEWSALEARLEACYGWSPSEQALASQPLTNSYGVGKGAGGTDGVRCKEKSSATFRFGSRMSAVSGRLKEASAAANMALLEQMSTGWHGLGLPLDSVKMRYAAEMVKQNVANSTKAKGPATKERGTEASAGGAKISFTDIGVMGNGGYATGELWGWLPCMDDLGTDDRIDHCGGGLPFADSEDDATPWLLRLEVLASWRAHPRALRFLSASEDESWLLTIGASSPEGGGGGGTVRVWSTGGPSPVVRVGDARQYGAVATHDSHPSMPTCASFLHGGAWRDGISRIASCDSSGHLHVWRADTGETLMRLREPPGSSAALKATLAPSSLTKNPSGGYGDVMTTAEVDGRSHSHAAADFLGFMGAGDVLGMSTASDHAGRAASPAASGDPQNTPQMTKPGSPAPIGDSTRANSGSFSGAYLMDGADMSTPGTSITNNQVRSPISGGGERSNTTESGGEVFAPAAYTFMTSVTDLRSGGGGGDLVLGTADGRIRFADVGAGKLLASWRCTPISGDGAGAVRTVCFPGRGGGSGGGGDGWLCAGMGHGHVTFLDRRGGRLIAGFPAHDGAVTSATVCNGVGGDGVIGSGHQLVTASADRTVAIWDVRKLTSSTGGGHRAALLASFYGFKDPITSLALHRVDAFTVAGGHLGVFSLAQRNSDGDQLSGGSSGDITGAGKGWMTSKQVKIAPLRLRSRSGGKEKAQMSSVVVLPQSRLFAVTTEDGVLKICR